MRSYNEWLAKIAQRRSEKTHRPSALPILDIDHAGSRTFNICAKLLGFRGVKARRVYCHPALSYGLDWRHKYNPTTAWARRYHPAVEESLSYLDESRVARDAAVAEREREREEQIARERRELEQAQLYAKQQHQAALRLRVLVRSLGVISLIAFVAVVAALVMAWRANNARHLVEAARQKLQKSRTALTLIQSYEMEQAEKELNEFYKLTANDEEGHENKAWVLYNLGDLNRRLERHDQAAAFFESALQTEMMIHGKLGLDSVGTLDSLAHTLDGRGKLRSRRVA